MAQVNLPITLGAAFWEKQKGALAKAPKAPPTKLGDELKALTRLHLGIDWGAFGDDKVDSVEAAKDRTAELEAAVKGKIKALVDQAKTVEAAAAKFDNEAGKDKQFPKEPLAAVASIVKAAKEYRADIDEFTSAAQKALAAKAATLVAQKAKAGASGGSADAKAVKMVRSRILTAISLVRNPKQGARPMRFLIVLGKLSATAFMGAAVGTAQEKLLKSVIPTEAPFKSLTDPQGHVIWEKNSVTFFSDHRPSGLAKRLQVWMKKILKLNLKLRVRKTTGEAEESEGEDIPEHLLKPDPADAVAPEELSEEFHQRLAALQADIKKGLAGAAGAQIKELMASIAQHVKDGKYDAADADLDEIEALLEEGGHASTAAATQPPASADAMSEWKDRRAAAVASLKTVAGKIAGAKHPSSTKAIIEIQGVMKNLTAEPSTLQQVTELQHWLGSDDVVNDVCELAEDIRTPLLAVLGRLRAQMTA